jgi:hypothetical protein
MQINHQLINENFFIPNWEIKYLLLGTFNPQGGDPVAYFYGRNRNRTWELLSDIFNVELHPNNDNFFELIQNLGIACMDMIQQVEIEDELVEHVIGNGYADKNIINGHVSRVYNTQNIIDVITANPNIRVFSTWGKGSKLNEWQQRLSEIRLVKKIIPLVSPSMVAKVPKGVEKFQYMLNDWRDKFNPNI